MPGKNDLEYQQAIQTAKQMSILSVVGHAVQLHKHAQTQLGGQEYCGPCPRCGGEDRFVVATGSNKWMCRHCTGAGRWEDPISLYAFITWGDIRPTGESFKRAVEEMTSGTRQFTVAAINHKTREEVTAERASVLAQFTQDELWAELHRRMGADQRAWWRARGIPDDWQDRWHLGYTSDRIFKYREELFHSPAYAIPYFAPAEQGGQKPVNLQFRLTQPINPDDKYRWMGKLGSSAYCCYPDLQTDEVFVCEGAIKAMNLAVYLVGDREIWAVPSKMDAAGLPELLAGRKRVWYIVDPDGDERANLFAAQTGDNARVVVLHGKLDDLILESGLTLTGLEAAMKYSRKASAAAMAEVARAKKHRAN